MERNSQEQDADARPAIANPIAPIDQYDVVLLGSGIWNARPPMIMNTFTEAHDFAGKVVHPFVTYAVSGLGSTDEVYKQACRGGKVSGGLAIRGEKVRSSGRQVDEWLKSIGLIEN